MCCHAESKDRSAEEQRAYEEELARSLKAEEEKRLQRRSENPSLEE